MGKLIIAGKERSDIDGLVNFNEGRRWNATVEGLLDTATGYMTQPGGCTGPTAKNKGPKRYSTRPALRRTPNPTVEAVQDVIKKFVLHHDGVSSSELCFQVLHNERGLSCHFLIDNDGTIYQTLDLALMGYHAAAYNSDSIGVEFCNRGILDDPNYYKNSPFPHPITDTYSINGHSMKSFDFTEQQYQAFFRLSQALVRELPNLALEYPRDPQQPSKQAWVTVGPITAEGDSIPQHDFAGFCGHYHLTTRKWDPGPFDFKKWIDKLRGQRVFPVKVAGAKLKDGQERPTIPDDPAELPAAIQPYYDANEISATAGFFPVGPWGVTRLWHGGIHLPAEANAPVYAPFAGRVIAGRMGRGTDIGSNNFVLMRHDLTIAQQAVRVYSLFMHLADDSAAADADKPPWLASPATPLDPEVAVDGYDFVVDAGQLIGHVGTVGPDDLSSPQIHMEIFSTQRWFETKPDDPNPSPFTLIDGSAMGRFCDAEELDALVDKDKDGRLSRQELADFFSGSDDEVVRNWITLHASEWAPEPDWTEALQSRPQQFQKGSGPKGRIKPIDKDDEKLDIARMVADQLTPFTWWTDPVAKALGLPASAIVYHYHPLKFIEYANQAHKAAAVAIDVNAKILDDNSDVEGNYGYVADPPPPPPDMHLKLENLVDGYAGDVPP